MRICFMAHAGSVHTQRFVAYFAERGRECHLVSFTPGPASGARLHLLAGRRPINPEGGNWRYILQLPRLRRLLRDLQPQLINAHFATSYGFLAALARPQRARLIVRVAGSDVLTLPERSPAHRLAARAALRAADAVLAPAAHLADAAQALAGRALRVFVRQYGVDTDLFHPPAGAGPAEPTCLCNRAWTRNSNIETILAALALLRGRGTPARLALAGAGPLEPALRARIAELGLEGSVTLLGRVAHRDMPALLRKHAVWVSTPLSDGLPMSLLEAMACAAFPVASDLPGYREFIEDGVNGFLAPPTDAAALADRLERALSDAALRARAAARNWSLVRERGDYRRNMADIEAFFTEIAD